MLLHGSRYQSHISRKKNVKVRSILVEKMSNNEN